MADQPVHPVPSTAIPTAKNIIICCDGTGNQFGDENSNVIKFYTSLIIDNDQVAYYHPGVGTMGDQGLRHRLARWWSKVKGLAFASGFQDNVFDACRYLMETYDDGDQVYLIGFSRGAYTARAVAGLLDGYGLLCRGNEGHLPYAWRLYTRQHKDRKKHRINPNEDDGLAFRETFSRKAFKSIRFLGIWDTVSSVGWIYTPVRLFDVGQNHLVETGRHAISIDERRCFYVDNLWGKPLPDVNGKPQDILQVWFPGVHSDVGGSYPQKESVLSNVTLKWMLDEAEKADVRLQKEREQIVLGKPDPQHQPLSKLYFPPTESIVHKSLKGLWWILEIFPHRYYDIDHGEEQWRVPLGARRKIPKDSFIHPTVPARIKANEDYDPQNIAFDDIKPSAIPGLDRYEPKTITPSSTAARILILWFFGICGTSLVLIVLFLLFKGLVCLWGYHLPTQVLVWLSGHLCTSCSMK